MRLLATMILLATAASAAGQSADEIFAATFEYRCDGNGCSYCSPADPQPLCGLNSHCLPDSGASLCAYPAGAGSAASACTTRADCAGPYECVSTGDSLTCRQWCQVATGTCPGGQTCFSFITPQTIGGTEWGVCL